MAMAISLLSYVVSDLCLGKPALKSLSITSTTVADALSALKSSSFKDSSISIWSCVCDHHSSSSSSSASFECKCVGKICMLDIICYLCKDENPSSPSSALNSPVSLILPKSSSPLVKHVEPTTSLIEAIEHILHGAHNLVVPIQQASKTPHFPRTKLPKPTAGGLTSTLHGDGGREYCWLTAEDVIRFILARISLFTPLPTLSVEYLGIINADILAVDHRSPASAALDAISRSLAEQTSLAVLDDDGYLISEISPLALSSCDETLAPAILTLSCSELVSYIDSLGPPEELVRIVKSRLRERNLEGILAVFDDEYSISFSASSDDESSSSSSSWEMASPVTLLPASSRRYSRSGRMPIMCNPGSSLIAVMMQAIAHRRNCVWVVEDDGSVAGIVGFRDMLEVFRDQVEAVGDEWDDC
ncbi:hypothetical protein Dimus_012637 [Dionaea muscipula]